MLVGPGHHKPQVLLVGPATSQEQATMTVVAFSPVRFTPADLAEFEEIARPRIDRGLWAGVVRHTTADADRLVVVFPQVARPIFLFERDQHGTYSLRFRYRDQGWRPIHTGSSAAECLSIWHLCRPAGHAIA